MRIIPMLLATFCAVSIATAAESGSFAASGEFKDEKKNPIFEKLGIYSKLVPGKGNEGVMNKMFAGSGLDWVLWPHAYYSIGTDIVTVFVYDPSGIMTSSAHVQESPVLMAFSKGMLTHQSLIMAKCVYPDGTMFPTANSMDQYEQMAMKMSIQSAAAAGKGVEESRNFMFIVNKRATLSPAEASEERILFAEETRILGADVATTNGRSRADHLRGIEIVRLKNQLNLPLAEKERALLLEAAARDTRSKILAAKDTTSPETRSGWNMILSIHEASAKGVSFLSKTVFTAEVLLLKDGVPMAAARQRSMAVGPTSGGLDNMATKNAYTLVGSFN